jgi:hypothetical protein
VTLTCKCSFARQSFPIQKSAFHFCSDHSNEEIERYNETLHDLVVETFNSDISNYGVVKETVKNLKVGDVLACRGGSLAYYGLTAKEKREKQSKLDPFMIMIVECVEERDSFIPNVGSDIDVLTEKVWKYVYFGEPKDGFIVSNYGEFYTDSKGTIDDSWLISYRPFLVMSR